MYSDGSHKAEQRLEAIKMIDEVLPNIYRIEVPLPRNPLRAINSYVIKGDDRALIVDTGMNREECVVNQRNGTLFEPNTLV
jgi:glyoxylase-like metal-dependent hydrolase (beta-lactamase superfamily II)